MSENDESEKAERIYKELLHEEASLWYISDNFGSKVMLKIPSVAIKALIKGCRIEFSFGKDTKQHPAMFHSGVRIFDDPVHYMSVNGIQRFMDEHTSLEKIMNRSQTYIHFHNELNICVAIATLIFELKDQLRVLNMLGNVDKLYVGDFDQLASRSLDCFEHSLKMGRTFDGVYDIDTMIIEGKLNEWQMMENHFFGVNENSKIVADDGNEGETFERQAWVSLESLFDTQIYRNPKVAHKKGVRELTDVLAFSDYGLFLIETKALGILSAQSEKTMEKKVKGLQQQIEKGIDQLVGAVKKLAEKVAVYDIKGREIFFNRELLAHCVVLVSELLPFGEWKEIELKMMVAMVENKIYLHVMDLREFMRYVGMARGNKDRLDYLLIERSKSFLEHETIHIRAREVFGDNEQTKTPG